MRFIKLVNNNFLFLCSLYKMTTINTTDITNTTNIKQDGISEFIDLNISNINYTNTLSVTSNFIINDIYNNTKIIIGNAVSDSYRYIIANNHLYFNNVVIGKTKMPVYPLEVFNGIRYPSGPTSVSYMSVFNYSAALNYYETYGEDICAFFEETVWTTDRIISSSDKRIKTNIQDINDDIALQMIMKIEPKKYEYIDKFERGDKKVYGFIAQQIREVIPEAVSIQSSIIPNIYKVGTLHNSNIITIDIDISIDILVPTLTLR